MDCKDCKNERAEKVDIISSMRFAHEREVATLERIITRLWIIILALIIFLVGTNCAWLYYEKQFEDVVISQEVEQTAENGSNSFIGVNNGNPKD